MKNCWIKRISSLFFGGLLAFGAAAPAWAAEGVSQPLQFHSDGTYKIMQIADTQDTDQTSTDLIRYLNQVLDREKPDLVVFTGDQVYGQLKTFQKEDAREKVERTIAHTVEPLVKRGIPFAVTFGNHDAESGVSREDQMKMYQSYPGCLAVDEGPELEGCGTYALPILSSDGNRTAFQIYVIDSLDYDPEGGYAAVSKGQIEWYKQTAEKTKKENGGKIVPAFSFQHIAVPEMYELLEKKGSRYTIKPEFQGEGVFLGENPGSPQKRNNGQFQAWLEEGDVIAAWFGHDHINNVVGQVEGLTLGYCPGIGFHTYGPGYQRAVRVFTLHEEAPAQYETRLVTYEEVCGRHVDDPVNFFFQTSVPFWWQTFGGWLILGGAIVIALLGGITSIPIIVIKKRRNSSGKNKN